MFFYDSMTFHRFMFIIGASQSGFIAEKNGNFIVIGINKISTTFMLTISIAFYEYHYTNFESLHI
jgi:hypothetical protein